MSGRNIIPSLGRRGYLDKQRFGVGGVLDSIEQRVRVDPCSTRAPSSAIWRELASAQDGHDSAKI